MKNDLVKIKKIFFVLLMLCYFFVFLYFFIAACSYFDAIQKFLYNINLNHLFYDDGIILPLAIFVPALIVIVAVVFLFYRKETSVQLRALLTVLSVWSIAAWLINTYIGYELAAGLRILCIVPVAISAVIAAFIVKELKKCIKN